MFEANTATTHNVLRAMDDAGVSKIAFTSSSTVYGESPRPTLEDYAPLEPISVHDTSKLADIVSDELGLDSGYEYTGGKRGWTG